jgi:hypothetical protein
MAFKEIIIIIIRGATALTNLGPAVYNEIHKKPVNTNFTVTNFLSKWHY